MNYVIIGNGPTGVIAAETLRGADPAGKVILVGDEPEPPYSRMAIPYLLMGDIQEEGTYLRKDKAHFRSLGIEMVQGRAKSLDTGKRQVILEDGKALAYDRLLIASGSRPVAAPIPGIDLPGVHSCWTLEDARAIQKLAKTGSRVLQMGAGFIGCIILEALASRGVQLTVVEMGNRMVPRMMTEGAGGLIKRWCEKKGVRVFTSTKVDAIEKAGAGLKVKLNNGQALEVDLVISATGVRPCVEWLKGSGVTVDAGVRVDDTMQTSVAGVYAAGDVAQAGEFYTGNLIVNAIQPNAADQGRVAALNMAGKGTKSQGSLAMNVLDTLGLISSSFGQWMGVPGGDHAELMDAENFRYLRLEFKDDLLVGATSLGLTQHVGVLRGLIQGRIRLGEWKQHLKQDPTRVMEAYLARAQSQDRRAA
ncbi:MAG TPA: FAD-dependent oxidoreductase [Burkholderiales bacterium]|nr:FAD-dependent oxidoreductase [Burkholderiales bacterium]